ncbi:MAG: hypothetical protein HKN43_06910, partial [Rhodothermales bacterium]|nr:hypothetical protein [Rhodothermales bacterium]
MKKKSPMELGRRERQIMSFIYTNGRATAAEVMDGIPDPPSYSGIRAMLRILEEKGHLKHEKDGARYVYLPTISPEEAGKSAMNYMVQAFFDGSAKRAVAALLDVEASEFTDRELDELAKRIDEARNKGHLSMIEQLLSADNFILDATPLLLASLLIKSSIVVGIAGAIAFLLRYSSASLRHIVLTIAMASLLVVPLLVLVLPAWELPLLPSNDTPEIDNAEAFAPKIADGELTTFVWSGDGQFSVSVTTPAPQAVADMIETQTPIQVESSPVQSAPSLAGMAEGRPWNWKAVLAMVWLSGVTIVLSRLFLAHAGVGLLLRRSRIVENEDWRFAVDRYARLLGIDRPVRIRTSALANVPMIIGCRRPILVLPEEFESWSEERRRIVLLHELAHVKRHDCFSQNIVEIVCAAYWFNPMVWLASRQIRVEREIACDDMVLMAGTKPSTYAQTILDTIKNIRQEEWSPVASIAMARKSDIEGRLISILDPDVRRAKLNRASAILTIGLIAAIAVPIALAVPVRKQAEPLAPEQPVADSADMPALAGESSWAPVVKNQAVESVEEPFSFEFDFDANDLFADDSPSSSWSTTTDVASAPEVDCCGTGTTLAVGRNSERAPTWTTSDTLTVKQLIKLRQYGVDLEFIDDLNALGYNDLNVDELIELAKYGADPEYISELNAAGYLQLQVDEIVRFSKYGVDGELIAALRAAGYKSITADEIVELSKYGLDEDDIAEFAQAGYANLPVDDLVSLSKYGVD